MMEKVDPSYLTHSPAASQWKSIGIKQHHGINLPLFSLHSSQSHGIGEFPDLIPIIDWCKSIGFDVIQLLPLNDSGHQSSPYSALSANALNPIYLGLNSLPYLNQFPELQNELKLIPKLPHSPRINYPHVREMKEHFMRHYYNTAGRLIINSHEYQTFLKESPWIESYARYKTLKEQNQCKSWIDWSSDTPPPDPNEIEWHCVLQYLCDKQLKEVKKHADSNHIFLMGDIPILINRDSVDVWEKGYLFKMDFDAGAPPDLLGPEGQNWGFPTYNWEEMANQDYKWWKERLTTASRYYHIYRLDHIVGFFRIWSIPVGKESKDGYYIPQNENIWIDHGQKILMMMLNSCPMLPIGEDLGNVPPLVRTCMHALGICGTKVMRWERYWNEDKRFILPEEYPLASMTTVSTHDTETLPLWWQNNPEEAEEYASQKGWGYYPVLNWDHLREILWDSHHCASLFHINLLQEYLALIPGMTWPDIEDERINVPGTISDSNWTYRFRPSVEEIIQNQSLSRLLKEIIT